MAKRPSIFGRPMRNSAGRSFGYDTWVLTFGAFIVVIDDAPLGCVWSVEGFGEHLAGDRVSTVADGVRRIETVLRQIGRSLPPQALLSRADWKAQNG